MELPRVLLPEGWHVQMATLKLEQPAAPSARTSSGTLAYHLENVGPGDRLSLEALAQCFHGVAAYSQQRSSHRAFDSSPFQELGSFDRNQHPCRVIGHPHFPDSFAPVSLHIERRQALDGVECMDPTCPSHDLATEPDVGDRHAAKVAAIGSRDEGPGSRAARCQQRYGHEPDAAALHVRSGYRGIAQAQCLLLRQRFLAPVVQRQSDEA